MPAQHVTVNYYIEKMKRFRKFRNTLIALYFSLIVSGSAAAEKKLSVPIYPDHSRLMYYLDSDGREYPVTTVADWAHRRWDILAGMQRAMGELPVRPVTSPCGAFQMSSSTLILPCFLG